ncbi:hypothetical protein F4225_03710 [Candidatus Poribacteria bacterium]|nr:hypothetical protein [Candidatus Poribacteria bacterium]
MRVDATSRQKEPKISKLTAPADGGTIVPSNRQIEKAACLIFANLIHSVNPVLGGTTKRTARYVCHPPTTFVGG